MNGATAFTEPLARTTPPLPSAAPTVADVTLEVMIHNDASAANPQISEFCVQNIATPLKTVLSNARLALAE